jgi:hypothetical protein
MRAVVVYEPGLATTRLVAQAVALGLNVARQRHGTTLN